jgi:hypothetical protein
LGFGTRGRLGRRGTLGSFGKPYWALVAPALDIMLSAGVLPSPEPARARARIVAAIEQSACIAVSLLSQETKAEWEALHIFERMVDLAFKRT